MISSAALARSCHVRTYCLHGARAVAVDLELQYTGGLMQRVIMTGLPGGAVRESRDRIRACLERCGLPVPRRSILAHFAPADLHKEGGGLDLPLLVGILALEGSLPASALAGRAILGELGLDGRLRPVRGALLAAMAARRAGLARLLLPRDNGAEAALVEGLLVEAPATVDEALEVLRGGRAPPPPAPADPPRSERLDLADVRGQAAARRALEIAAAGRHNLLLSGPPGTGKTMLAQRLPGLLPPLSDEQCLDATALHGLAAAGPATVIRHPPFRAPHHTVSRAGLIGGGAPVVPGEASLAHAGVLFLDEMPEFRRELLEALRQPIEERLIRLARVGTTVAFPADFQLVGAMNPCACGYLGHPKRGCKCTAHELQLYRRRISGPLLDRFDLFVEVPVPAAEELIGGPPGETTAAVAPRVASAAARLGPRRGVRRAASAPADPRARERLRRAASSFGLSGRGVARVVSVAMTIAALAGRDAIGAPDVDEALSYRLGLMAFGGK